MRKFKCYFVITCQPKVLGQTLSSRRENLLCLALAVASFNLPESSMFADGGPQDVEVHGLHSLSPISLPPQPFKKLHPTAAREWQR